MNATWLILDDQGTILAIVKAEMGQAQQVADVMSAHAELTLNPTWHIGDHLPVWHD
jgi:hypothetical protein